MDQRRVSRYVFDILEINVNTMRRASTYSLVDGRIRTPSESGVYDMNFRKLSVPEPSPRPPQDTLQMLGLKSQTLKGEKQIGKTEHEQGFSPFSTILSITPKNKFQLSYVYVVVCKHVQFGGALNFFGLLRR